MKKILLFALFILAAALTLLLRLHAADNAEEMLRRWRMAEEDKVDGRIDKMSKALQLSDAQKIDLKAAYEERINKLSDLRQQYIRGTRDVETAVDNKILAALTPDQLKQYPAVKEKIQMEERNAEMDARRGGEGNAEGEGHRGMHGAGRGVGEGMGGGHGMEGGRY